MYPMKKALKGTINHDPKGAAGFRQNGVFVVGIAMLVLAGFFWMLPFCSATFAADVGRYQVVSGGGDNAYLVDTTSGAVWVLTHRTLATGREPVAIPYKFIQIAPSDGNQFIVEMLKNEQAGPKDKEPVKSE
ncbi:MAG: hypothetical protein JW950_03840 [Deltaproteobacteria bacterium]|nr:hypothetical protein [Deltaproteobacteria bacterium]